VDHAYAYGNGVFDVHLHAHMYPESIPKKGANSVASLVMQMMQEQNWLHDNKMGGELNIIFDNCSGQDKNNTMLRLMTMLDKLQYFKKIILYSFSCSALKECV
jgi:hypothetical protein